MTNRAEESAPASSSRAAVSVGAGIFLTRIAGFVRSAVEATLFGTSAWMDVWAASIRIPNVIQILLGEGTLSASMVPVYSELLEEGREEEAGRFAGAALGLITVVVWSVALIGVLASPAIAGLFVKFTPEQQELLATLLRVLFPMVAFISMSAWALAILNSHRRFFVSYLAPAAWNLALITTMVVFGWVLGWEAQGRTVDVIVALGWGALVGGALQLLVQLPWLRPVLRHFRLSISTRVTGVREAIRAFLPVVSARGVASLSGALEAFVAAFLMSGAVAGLYYANRFYLLPISLFGLSIAAAELPELSRQRRDGLDELTRRVGDGLWRVLYFVVPIACLYLAAGDLVVGPLYERNRFMADSTVLVYAVLGAYSLGLPATAASRMLSSAFYALRDTKTPAQLSVFRLALSLTLGIILMATFDEWSYGAKHFGAVGLALGSAIAAWIEYGLLRRALTRDLPGHGASGPVFRVVAASLLAGAAAFGAKWVLGGRMPARDGLLGVPLEGSGWLHLGLSGAGTALAFGVVWWMARPPLRS